MYVSLVIVVIILINNKYFLSHQLSVEYCNFTRYRCVISKVNFSSSWILLLSSTLVFFPFFFKSFYSSQYIFPQSDKENLSQISPFSYIYARLGATQLFKLRSMVCSIDVYFEARFLFGFIDRCPYKFFHNDEFHSPNPKFKLLHAQDHVPATLINATLSQIALSFIDGCTTSTQVWDSLEKHFSSSTRTSIIGLKSKLHRISKKSIVDDYI